MICVILVISVNFHGGEICSVFCCRCRVRGVDLIIIKKFHMIFKTVPNMHVFGEGSSIITDASALYFDSD